MRNGVNKIKNNYKAKNDVIVDWIMFSNINWRLWRRYRRRRWRIAKKISSPAAWCYFDKFGKRRCSTRNWFIDLQTRGLVTLIPGPNTRRYNFWSRKFRRESQLIKIAMSCICLYMITSFTFFSRPKNHTIVYYSSATFAPCAVDTEQNEFWIDRDKTYLRI